MKKYLLTLVGLAIGAIYIFTFTDADIQTMRYFYSLGNCWCLADIGFWKFLYVYGIYAAYLPVISALIILILGFWWPERFLVWRKSAIFLILTMILGPGLLVNAILKDHWGRARPREVMALGGLEPFSKPWEYGASKGGKSFPCGHCSMGFLMGVPFLIFRKRNKWLAYSFLLGGIGLGFVIGYARMLAGGHFLSDVVWSALVVWTVALFLFYILKVDKPFVYDPGKHQQDKTKAKWVTASVGLAFALLTVGLLVATPYISNKTWYKTTDELQAESIRSLQFQIPEGTVHLKFDSLYGLQYHVYAFGFPNSKMGIGFRVLNDTAFISIDKTGFFTEVRNQIYLHLPKQDTMPLKLVLRKGKVLVTQKNMLPKNVVIESPEIIYNDIP